MPSLRKEIWLPTSEMKVTVTNEGAVTVWEEMVMKRQALKPALGFPKEKKEGEHERRTDRSRSNAEGMAPEGGRDH